MNDQYFRERDNIPDDVEKTDQNTNKPVVNPDPLSDRVPADARTHETSMLQTPVQEIPTDETLHYKETVDKTIADESQTNKSVPYKAPVPMGETTTHAAPANANSGSLATLLTHEESDHFRTRWNEIQGMFVDEPRSAVQQADELVSEVVEKITQMFANEHGSLESQWKQGEDVSTEDLRKALQLYRSFFNRLVV